MNSTNFLLVIFSVFFLFAFSSALSRFSFDFGDQDEEVEQEKVGVKAMDAWFGSKKNRIAMFLAQTVAYVISNNC